MDRGRIGKQKSQNADAESKLIDRQPIGDAIYETLLARLISSDIPPGERLAVDALVRELGVSQTPIRSALIRLEMDGLVTKRHNAGYSAAPMPSGERFREIYDFRLLLEPAAAAQAASRMTKDVVTELMALDAAMAELFLSEDSAAYGKFAVLDARFHRLIADTCGNSLVSDALCRLHTHMHLFRLRHHSTVTGHAIEEHRVLLKALLKRDPGSSSNAMRKHVIASRDRMAPFYEAATGQQPLTSDELDSRLGSPPLSMLLIKPNSQ